MFSKEMESLKAYEELRNRTVPELLVKRARNTPGATAYLSKKKGIYHKHTWSEFHKMVAGCAMAFMEMGLATGNTAALMGDPSEEYVIAELAAQSLGAITYGIYPTSSQKEINYLMNDGGASIFIAGNHEYVDRLLPLIDELKELRHIVVIDTKGMFTHSHPLITSFQEIMHKGRNLLLTNEKAFDECVNRIKPSDSLSIIYTSGTTGDPKGALISHGKHLASSYTLIERYPILAQGTHRVVIYLPLCHIVGKITAITLPLLTNIIPHYGEDIEDLEQTIFETAPTVLFTVPRYIQKFASKMLVGIQNTTFLKRSLYRIAVAVGRRHIKNLWEGRKNTAVSFGYFLCYLAVFKPILNKIGFDKLKLLLSVGAPLPPELTALWQIYGVNLSDIYGQTETGGATIASQGAYFPKPGDVGIPPLGWEVKIAENGEILVRGLDMFDGYWNNPAMTKEVLDADGWLHTGDTGEWTTKGHLKILDRVRDIIVTSGGKTLSPTYIENALRASPYINEAVVFGNNRNHITALIEIDFDTVSAWARLNGVAYTGFNDLCKNEKTVELIDGEVEKTNKDLARVEQVKAFRIIPQELDPWHDGEPITPTRKVKRDLMYRKFEPLIESMYTDRKEQELVTSEIGDVLLSHP